MDVTKMAVEVFDKKALLYQSKFMDLSLYHDTFDYFCEALKIDNASILELACGPGNITQYILKKYPNLKILGTDLAPKMLALARSNNPTATFKLMDVRAIDVLDTKYDGIICGFGLPYLSQEEAIKLIKDATGLLNEGGLLYLSTMEDEYEKSGLKWSSSGEEQAYIYYHEANYLTKAIEDSGLKLLELKRKHYMPKEGDATIDLVLIAQKL